MRVPVRLTVRGVATSGLIEDAIRARVEDLKRREQRLTRYAHADVRTAIAGAFDDVFRALRTDAGDTPRPWEHAAIMRRSQPHHDNREVVP